MTLSRITLPQTKRGDHAYLWTAIFIGLVAVAATMVNAVGWFSLPMDPTGAGAWFFAVTVMLIAPFMLLVLLASWGVLAIYRKAGTRRWPSALQALLASSTVLLLLAIGVRLLFARYE